MLESVLVLAVVATLSPVLAGVAARWVRIPQVVLEIVLGMLAGPAVLGLVTDLGIVEELSNFGLAMLFFMAGMEIDFKRIKGRPIRRSYLGWVLAVLIGFGVGLLAGPTIPSAVYIGVALSSTALGTLMPTLLDSGELRTPFGTSVIAIGAVGEFGPLVAISIFLSSRTPGVAAAVLIGFVVLTVALIVVAARGRHRTLQRLIERTLHTSGQFAIRIVVLMLAGLVALSVALDLDMLLGAFAAGVLMQFLLAGARRDTAKVVRTKLDAVAFGVLVPIFFIGTGLQYDLEALLAQPWWWAILLGFLVLMLLVRGLTGLLSAPRGATWADRRSLVLLTATGLPIIVAVNDIAVERQEISAGLAAAMVGAGLLSVLLFPTLAMLGRTPPVAQEADDDDPLLDPQLIAEQDDFT